MSYCLNPTCNNPDNPPTNTYCHGCGLLLANSSQSYQFRVHYKIIKKLGEGNFGRTYLAEDMDLKNEPRVIKKLIATGTGNHLVKIKELFEREADRLYDLNHSQIPKLYAYFEENNSLYLIQEFIEGQDLLSEWHQQGNFSEAKIKKGLRELLPVLEYIHKNKVLHRDIKPENIMRRSSDDKLVLIDFGGAKQTTENRLSLPGTTLYTPGYAAREHMRGRPKVTSDIYSLGVTMVRLLTGSFVDFDEDSNIDDPLYDEDNGQWLWQNYARTKEIKVSSHLANVLDKMIEDLAKNRYQSATEVLKALNSAPQPEVKTSQPEVKPSQPEVKPSQPEVKPSQPEVKPPQSQPTKILITPPQKIPAKTIQTTPQRDYLQQREPSQKIQNTFPRRNFFKWMGWGGASLASVMISSYLWSNRDGYFSAVEDDSPQNNANDHTQPRENVDSSLKTFSFEVVTVNSRGKIINRESKFAKYFTARLGNGVTMDLVAIPGGKFLMGSPLSEEGRYKNESPQHRVIVPEFFMGKYQVTQAQWQAVMGNNPSYFKGENRPVEEVSWDDCMEFCQKLSRIIGRECRLPSEAEWEYACRAGTTTPFHFGETITTDLANYCGKDHTEYGWKGTYADEPQGVYREETTAVGQFPPNAFGLYDMHGNVSEWCLDEWHDNYEGAPTDGSAWLNGNNNYSPLRGGSWYLNPNFCRSASRDDNSRDLILINLGFRVVCSGRRTFEN